MKTKVKFLALGALALSMVLNSCSKESIEPPFQGVQQLQVHNETRSHENAAPENSGIYDFQIEDKFPTDQLVLNFPPLTEEEMKTKVVKVYLIGTTEGKEQLYQVPGIGAHGDHQLYKIDTNGATVVEFSDSNRNPISLAFGYYKKAKIMVVNRNQQ